MDSIILGFIISLINSPVLQLQTAMVVLAIITVFLPKEKKKS